MTFLTTLPLWLSAVVLIVPTTLLAMAGPVIVRRYVELSQLRTNNEVGGFKFATVGVLYAVINDIIRQGIFDFDTPRLQLKHGPPIRWPIASAGDASPRGMVVRCLHFLHILESDPIIRK
jgi:hypothetical protein